MFKREIEKMTEQPDEAKAKVKTQQTARASLMMSAGLSQLWEVPHRTKTSILYQFYILLQRSATQKFRSYAEVITNIITLMVCGLLVGVLLSSDHQPFDPEDPKLPLMMALVTSIVGTLSAVSSLSVFGRDKVMFIRENESGMSSLAFFLAKIALDSLENIWQPLFFLGISYSFIQPQMSAGNMAAILCVTSYTASGIGILSSLVLSKGNMTLVTVLVSLVIGIFMNGTIGLYFTNVKKNDLDWLWACSYSRWANEALLVAELKEASKEPYQDLLARETLMYYGYFPRSQTESEWKVDNPTSMEKEQSFQEYFDDAVNISYKSLMIIAIVLRLLAFMTLAIVPTIVRLIDYIRLRIVLYVSEVTKEQLATMKEHMQSLTTNLTGEVTSDSRRPASAAEAPSKANVRNKFQDMLASPVSASELARKMQEAQTLRGTEMAALGSHTATPAPEGEVAVDSIVQSASNEPTNQRAAMDMMPEKVNMSPFVNTGGAAIEPQDVHLDDYQTARDLDKEGDADELSSHGTI
ncbi:hypothetical protein CYMTET_46788 [Cymbomonas tetramitiformis]|uniref:ABC transporter family G domain-containing protein n=1 Tax=Cymbomonas tetramitiformis TaxID=36881 RepID=A0AAE0BXH4_9CHLO|nr:hypothetical protein CYMTET_46788 [Cymbomonas tetramitiformis]